MSMNTISTRINVIFLATMVACAPVCASENQSVTIVAEQQDPTNTQDSVVWYKKRSTHIMAALAATAVGIYALAVRKNKIAGPMALFTALFCANKKAQEVKNVDEIKDAHKEQQPEGAGVKLPDNQTKPIVENSSSNENKQVISIPQDIVENSKPLDPLSPHDQKPVTQEPAITGVNVAENKEENVAQNKEENGQPLTKTEDVKDKNIQLTREAPIHIKAQQYKDGLLSVLKQGFKDGRLFRTSAK